VLQRDQVMWVHVRKVREEGMWGVTHGRGPQMHTVGIWRGFGEGRGGVMDPGEGLCEGEQEVCVGHSRGLRTTADSLRVHAVADCEQVKGHSPGVWVKMC